LTLAAPKIASIVANPAGKRPDCWN